MECMSRYQEISESVIKGNAQAVVDLIKAALDKGENPKEIINEGLIGGMQVVAERFKNNEMYIPEVLVAARAMNKGLEIIKPLISDSDMQPLATVVVGTVKGDLHDIGKNLVCMMLEGAGFKVIDIGINVSEDAFAKAVEEHQPDVLGMSALLTTTMISIGNTIEALKQRGLRDKVKIIVGGAPVTDAYAKEVGADGYAPDAGSAVDLVKKLLA
jgi:5-methyltetrahydrofolate--homocysteine methyltransferase